MDIEKKRHLHAFNIKRFTIGATASAMLLLNAKEAVAEITCPLLISSPISACNFNANNSVTVENGGSVSGDGIASAAIVMAGYTASTITINTGGAVNNTTSAGISISGSTLTNGLTNNGSISASSSVGIQIQGGSTINGGITNSGTISASSTGVSIGGSVVSGGITNSGTISSSTHGTGIKIFSTSTVNGAISNSGTIQGSNNDPGIAILGSTVGDITNSGLIKAAGSGAGITINAGSTTGDISNSGTIESTYNTGMDVNISTIDGDISNSGTIGGAINGLSIHNASNVNGNIFNTGTIRGDQNGLSVYSSANISGHISNSGTIQGGNIGIAVINSPNAIIGSISNTGTIQGGTTGIAVTGASNTITGGISNNGTIQGGTYAIFVGNSNTVSDINILGKSARLIGAVDASGTTFNITSDAVFTSEGTFNVQNFNIDATAVFNMDNAITVTNVVNNAGTLSLGTTNRITGNYTQNTGGTLQIAATSATNYAQLIVNGEANLLQSGNIDVQVQKNAALKSGDVLTNVISGSTFDAPTGGYIVTDNSFFWDFTAATAPGGTGVNLTATINPVVFQACQGRYCEGAANVIIGQVGAGNTVFNPYSGISTESAFQTAASQATPELTNENIQVIRLITNSAMDIVPMWSIVHGKSDEDALRYQPSKVWVKPYGGSMNQGESNTVEGFNATAYGAVIGRDAQPSANWLVGGAFAAGGDNISGKSNLNGESINSGVYQGILYGVRKFSHHLYLAEQGLVGYGDNSTERSIPTYASTAQGSYNSWFANFRTELGWNVYAGSDFVFTPELDVSYLFVNQSAYKESGSAMDLSVDANNNSSLVLGAYAHGAYHLTNLNALKYFSLGAYAGIACDVLNGQPQTTASFVAGGSSFSTFGVQFNQVVFRGGVGLLLDNPIKPITMSLNYDLQAGNNAFSNVGSVTLGYKL